MIDIAASRLQAQRLVGEQPASVLHVVHYLTAVQSQDYTGAKWALGQRTANTTDAEVDRLFDEGRILRLHVMRPTWHFVLPEDIRWLVDLTGPRLLQNLAGPLRQQGIEDADISRVMAIFTGALSGGRFLTRPELGEALRANGIAPDGLRLTNLVIAAEALGVVTSGPRRGKQFTYALLAERVPNTRTLDRDDALAELTRRYFRSHGPAQIKDFVWWSGLTVADARAGLALVGPDLDHLAVDGKEYWFDARVASNEPMPLVGHLLPNWDEYTVAYRDRAAALAPDRPFDPSLFSFGGSILDNVVTITGHIRGAWRRVRDRESFRLECRLLEPLDDREAAAVDSARDRLSRFLGVPVTSTTI